MNEERTIAQLVQQVHTSCASFSQIIFVDDGSTDSSNAIVRKLAHPQDLILEKTNGGKGSAVRMGYRYACGTYTIVQDADLEYRPSEIPLLLAFAEQNQALAVFGSRRLKRQKQFVHLSYFLGGTALTYLCNLLFGTRLTDQPTCYKLVKTSTLHTLPLRENDFRFDPELTVMLARSGVNILEYPISYTPRSIAEGKKIHWKDWFRWVWIFLKLRVLPFRSDSRRMEPLGEPM